MSSPRTASHARRLHPGPAVVMVAAAALLVTAAACSSDDAATRTSATDVPATTQATATTAAPVGSDKLYPAGLRNVRYCEVLLLRHPAETFHAEVWNTLGMSDCPPSDWAALDAAAIASERGAVAAIKNGPRHWTLDTIVSDIRSTAPTTSFGPIGMFLAADLELGASIPDQRPYVVRSVARETVFRFRAGRVVHELTDPDGTVYVMQSYALIKDPNLTIDQLDTLAGALTLPAGWTYSTRELDTDLDLVGTDGVATVVQDDLQNTYQRNDAAMTAR